MRDIDRAIAKEMTYDIVSEITDELRRIRKYLRRKEKWFTDFIEVNDNPELIEYREAKKALTETQRCFAEMTEIYNRIVKEFNYKYYKKLKEREEGRT